MDIKPLNKWIPNLKKPLVIAGPCSAETEEQVLKIAHEVSKIEDVRIFRAGIWKPRTRPNSFEGVGEKALAWMQKAKKETGLMTTIEVANASHVELALKYGIDILWIGARTTVNPFAVQEIADAIKGSNIPVMVKNPINADLALWIGAIERIHGAGIDKIAAIHRGFSVHEECKYRNIPLWRFPIELQRQFPTLPIINDPSHITGNPAYIPKVCQKAMDIDMAGLMVEVHHDPASAWSDAKQQITADELQSVLRELSYKTEYSHSKSFEKELDILRGKIDRVDQELMDVLKMRMDIVNDIGDLKMKNHVTAFQVHRMGKLIDSRMKKAQAVGLDPDYIKEIYDTIHNESVKKQTEIMNQFKEQK